MISQHVFVIKSKLFFISRSLLFEKATSDQNWWMSENFCSVSKVVYRKVLGIGNIAENSFLSISVMSHKNAATLLPGC